MTLVNFRYAAALFYARHLKAENLKNSHGKPVLSASRRFLRSKNRIPEGFHKIIFFRFSPKADIEKGCGISEVVISS
jgi:hypothetical protein